MSEQSCASMPTILFSTWRKSRSHSLTTVLAFSRSNARSIHLYVAPTRPDTIESRLFLTLNPTFSNNRPNIEKQLLIRQYIISIWNNIISCCLWAFGFSFIYRLLCSLEIFSLLFGINFLLEQQVYIYAIR